MSWTAPGYLFSFVSCNFILLPFCFLFLLVLPLLLFLICLFFYFIFFVYQRCVTVCIYIFLLHQAVNYPRL